MLRKISLLTMVRNGLMVNWIELANISIISAYSLLIYVVRYRPRFHTEPHTLVHDIRPNHKHRQKFRTNMHIEVTCRHTHRTHITSNPKAIPKAPSSTNTITISLTKPSMEADSIG